MNNSITNKQDTSLVLSLPVIWSGVWQLKLPIELCKIILYYSLEMYPNLKRDLHIYFSQKNFTILEKLPYPCYDYCCVCGEYEIPPLIDINTGEQIPKHNNFCKC